MLVCAAATMSSGFVVTQVHATEYMSAADSQKLMFADASEFVPIVVALNPDQLRQLADRAGGPARRARGASGKHARAPPCSAMWWPMR